MNRHIMEYEITALEQARIGAERSGCLVDLIDTNFHANGLRYPMERLAERTTAFLQHHRYRPESLGARTAREAVAGWYRADAGQTVDPDHIVIAASASECYSLIFQALAGHGDGVILPSPGYPLFEHIAGYTRLSTSHYRMRFDRRFHIDPQQVADAIRSDSRFLVLISPNNPTGRLASDQEVSALLRLCREAGLILICDEVFSACLYQDTGLPRPMTHARVEGVVVMTINGLSKLRSAPELKLSWIAVCGPDAEVNAAVAELELANDMYLSCTPLSQHLLPPVLADSGHGRFLRDTLDKRRRILVDAFASMRGLTLCEPNAGIHAIARLRIDRLPGDLHDDEAYALALLNETGVHLHPGYLYGIDDESCLVVSFLKEPTRLVHGLSLLRAHDSRISR